MSIKRTVIYPKPLDEKKTEDLYTELGFTKSEVVALQNAWSVLKRRFRRHAFETFISFFAKHEHLLERFRDSNGHFRMNKLTTHAEKMLASYGEVIENCLHNVSKLNLILVDIIEIHYGCSVLEEEMMTMSRWFRDYILLVLDNISSPSLESSLNKLIQHLAKHYEDVEIQKLFTSGLSNTIETNDAIATVDFKASEPNE